ncbi:MAG: hypothetical protein BWY63_03574 [Chloroflexi bacterium ADurb.Bin360]|nr:MAG: hypothetical protein BWY63_03574 [Chloroflexi bacterium ADurb.Bin360]
MRALLLKVMREDIFKVVQLIQVVNLPCASRKLRPIGEGWCTHQGALEGRWSESLQRAIWLVNFNSQHA